MAEEAKKLGPNVTYNPPEGAPEVTEVGGVPMVKGEAVNVIDILGEANGGAVAVGDHQRRVVGGDIGLIVGVDLKAASAVVDRALRAVGVG